MGAELVTTVEKTTIEGLWHIRLDHHSDERGSFREVFRSDKLTNVNASFRPEALNVSMSKKGTIRGIHAEPWGKYLHPIHGSVFSAIVDLRTDSENFGRVETFRLTQRDALLIPAGCGNSFGALTEPTVVAYMVNGFWQPGIEYPAVRFNDPDLNIPWPIPPMERIVSEKDQNNPTLQEAFAR